MDLISIEKQLSKITSNIASPHPVSVSIAEALGLLCAEEVLTEQPLPDFDLAIIDGYAVRSIDLRSKDADTEIRLPIVGDVSAGMITPNRLQPRQTVFVEAGGSIPALADAILPERWVEKIDDEIIVKKRVKSGDYVRRVGDDLQAGEKIVNKGDLIGPNHIGLLASIGKAKINVYPKPRATILAVGNGIIEVGESSRKGYSYDVDTYALAAAAKEAGAEVNRMGILPNDLTEAQNILQSAVDKSELVIISSGVGGRVAARFQKIIEKLGKVEISRVAMHPGSLQGFGVLGSQKVPTFLLPADPVSVTVIFEILIRPAIRAALGKHNLFRRTLQAKALSEFNSAEGKIGFLQGQLLRDSDTGEYFVQNIEALPGMGNTRNLAALSRANCLIVIPSEVTKVNKNDLVEVSFLGQAT